MSAMHQFEGPIDDIHLADAVKGIVNISIADVERLDGSPWTLCQGLHEPVHSGNEFVVELRNLATLILRGRFRWTTDRTSC